jgi:hypothetical protein
MQEKAVLRLRPMRRLLSLSLKPLLLVNIEPLLLWNVMSLLQATLPSLLSGERQERAPRPAIRTKE